MRTYQGWNIRGDPIIEKSQDQDQGQGQGQDHLLPQRAALPPFLVLALTLTLVLALVRNIIIFSKVRVLVLNQPIIRPQGVSEGLNWMKSRLPIHF